jgi:hypothetical protein
MGKPAREQWIAVGLTVCREQEGKVSKLCVADLTTSDTSEEETFDNVELVKEAPNLLYVLMEIEDELKRPGLRSASDILPGGTTAS